MSRRIQVVIIATIAVILLSLAGFWILSAASADAGDTSYPPIDNALSIYTSAVENMNSAEKVTLNITKNVSTTIGGEIFEEKSQISYSYQGLGTQDMLARAKETVTMGSHAFTTQERYADGKAYVTVNDSHFVSDISSADFSARFAPAVCFTPDLYARVSGVDTGDSYIIFFEKAGGVEGWITDPRTGFVSGNGAAYISYDGKLLNSVYNVSYKNENAIVTLSYMIVPSPWEDLADNTDETANYMQISYIDGPKLLEKATGYLLQGQNLSAKYTENIYFEVFGDKRTQSIDLYTGFEQDWCGLVKTQKTLVNTSREGEVSGSNETQLFLDNTFYASKDNGALTAESSITTDVMKKYCQDRLLSTVIMPTHIGGCSITEGKTSVTVRFSGNETFARLISENACQTFYQNPDLLKQMAESSSTKQLNCYLEVDKTTGLPLSAGIDYSGTFTIAEIPYELSFKADQSYTIPNNGSMEIIKKAAE